MNRGRNTPRRPVNPGVPHEAAAQIVATSTNRPQRVLGGVRSDVVCEASGDSLAITISDMAKNGVAPWHWRLTVYAQLPGGQFQLGEVLPQAPGDMAGIPSARVVAIATCPGARGWMVSFYSTTATAAADVTLSPSPYPCSPAGVTLTTPGLTP